MRRKAELVDHPQAGKGIAAKDKAGSITRKAGRIARHHGNQRRGGRHVHQRGNLGGSAIAWRIDDGHIRRGQRLGGQRGVGQIGLPCDQLGPAPGRIHTGFQRGERGPVRFRRQNTHPARKKRQPQRAASRKEIDKLSRSGNAGSGGKAGDIRLHHLFRLDGGLQESAGRRGDGDAAKRQCRRRRGIDGQGRILAGPPACNGH